MVGLCSTGPEVREPVRRGYGGPSNLATEYMVYNARRRPLSPAYDSPTWAWTVSRLDAIP